MSPADLIQELRDEAAEFLNSARTADNGFNAEMDEATSRLLSRAADSLASKDTALAEIRADRDAICKMLVIANAQLADMEFLTVEGFMGWKQDRASRSISQDGEERTK